MADSEKLKNPISTRELERRWAAVRVAMDERGIDVLVMQNNNEFLGGYIKWFTDVPAKNAYPHSLLFPVDDRMTVVRMGPMDGVQEISQDDFANRGIKKLLTNPSFASVHYTGEYDARQILGELEPRGDRTIGLVGTAGMSHAFVDCLKGAALPNARFVDATEWVDRIKVIKSPEEIARIRQTARMQDEVVAEVAKTIKPGMRDYEITALAQYAGQMRGSDQGIFLGGSAPLGEPSMFVPRHFQGRELKEGDHLALLVENNGYGGYYTEISRTFVLGRASRELLDSFEMVKEAQRNTLNNLEPGASCKEIFLAHNAFMKSRGLPEETRIYAHGQGYDMVERPLIRDDETMEIAENMNIVVHPAFKRSSGFTVVCDNYMITKTGPSECLHETPQKIFEIC